MSSEREGRGKARPRRALAAVLLPALLLSILVSPLPAAGASSTDLEIREIDSSALSCGRCQSTIRVVVGNRGRALDPQYRVLVDLEVRSPGASGKKEKHRLERSGFPNGSESFEFRGIRLLTCEGGEASIEAKVSIPDEGFRESNIYNNKKLVSKEIQKACP